MNIQKLFKPYFVRRKNGQCQVLIPLVELDELCEKINRLYFPKNITKTTGGVRETICEKFRAVESIKDYWCESILDHEDPETGNQIWSYRIIE